MASTSAPQNKRLFDRINAVRHEVTDPFDGPKLDYILKQITPKGLERRSDEDQDVSHLHEVALHIIKPIENRKPTTDA